MQRGARIDQTQINLSALRREQFKNAPRKEVRVARLPSACRCIPGKSTSHFEWEQRKARAEVSGGDPFLASLHLSFYGVDRSPERSWK
jgi:hypothetical protein